MGYSNMFAYQGHSFMFAYHRDVDLFDTYHKGFWHVWLFIMGDFDMLPAYHEDSDILIE